MAVIYNYEFVKEKINSELKEASKSSDKKIRAIAKPVSERLILFSKNKTFGLVIQASEKTLSDCCKEILKDVGGSISDIEVFRRAAKFYFPTAEVEFTMDIKLSDEELKSDNQKISISFDDLF